MTINVSSQLFNLSLTTVDERKELARIVKLLPKNAVIVEVGSFMGGSAALMATANPTAQIHCFDLFEDDKNKSYRGNYQYDSFYELLGHDGDRTIENVRKVLKQFDNISLYKKKSPDGIIWDSPVDLYFEDGLHIDPRLAMNLDFWTSKVKKDGYVLIHDCRPWLPLEHFLRCVDVEKSVEILLLNGYELISHVGSLVVLKKIGQ
jgi:hypothetical protein